MPLFSRRASLPASIAVVVFLAVSWWWRDWAAHRDQAKAFVALCEAEHSPSDCVEWADRYGDRCYELSYVRGGRASRGHLNVVAYRTCLFNSGRLGR